MTEPTLIEKLRDPGAMVGDVKDSIKMCHDAANEIERLLAERTVTLSETWSKQAGEITRLRAALKGIAEYCEQALRANEQNVAK